MAGVNSSDPMIQLVTFVCGVIDRRPSTLVGFEVADVEAEAEAEVAGAEVEGAEAEESAGCEGMRTCGVSSRLTKPVTNDILRIRCHGPQGIK